MDKPIKPTETLAESFGGIKENFTEEKIENGYQPDIPDILAGTNLNYLLDTIGKKFKYNDTISDYLKDMPIGYVPYVDNNNKLTYTNDVSFKSKDETIAGAKTLTKPLKIQNGAGAGSLIIGGDVNAGTLTNGARKLARVAVPTQTNIDLTAILLGFDSSGDADLNITNKSYDNIAFGGSKKITNATSPMSISFCVATERNAKESSKKRYTLEMDSNEARFNVQPNYNGKPLALKEEIESGLPIGTIIPVNASSTYVPDGCLPCDGTEYTREQFTDFCKNYLDGEYSQYLATCTYEKFEEEIATYGQCSKFAVKGNTTIKADTRYTTASIQVLPIILKAYPSGVELEFTYDGTSWLLDGKAVALSDYYITATGTPTAGDHFTVTAALIETFRVPLIKDTETEVTNNIDYANKLVLGSTPVEATPFIAPYDGVLIFTIAQNVNAYRYCYINGVRSPHQYQDGEGITTADTYHIPLSKGDSLYWTSAITLKDGGFYPYKEATKEKLKSFVVVANGQTNQSMMDWSAWASSLQGKANNDLSNCTKPYIVEMSDKSLLPSWYKIYSNGWCEQGGETTNTGTSIATVTFLKPFVNNTFTVLAVKKSASGKNANNQAGWNIQEKTLTSFNYAQGDTNGQGCFWEAKGYIS